MMLYFFLEHDETEPKITTLKTDNLPTRKLIHEVKPGKKSEKSEFAKNLQNKYLQENNNNTDEDKNVKIYENIQNQIEVVSTKQIIVKKPLFGRAYFPKTGEVKIKFLLNGVDNLKSVFFFLPEKVIHSCSYIKKHSLSRGG